MSQHTATDADRRPRQAYWGDQQSVTQFCDYHGLHMSFLPLKARRRKVWDQLETIRENLTDIPETKQHIEISDVIPSGRLGSHEVVRDLLWACGSYRAGQERSVDWWANPNYVHGDEHIEPTEDIQTHIERAIAVPFVGLDDIAPRFNMTVSAMHNHVHRAGYDFREEQYSRKLDVARSIRCAMEWTFTLRPTFYKILPAPDRTVRNWLEAVDDFAVPEYPDYSRFQPREKYRQGD